MPNKIASIRFDMLDYPTAWAVQRRGGLKHHPRCSCVAGWDPISGPSFLCDCGAVIEEWKRMIKMDADPTRDFAGFKFDEIIEEAERRYRGYCTSFGVDPERTVSSRDTVGFWYARVAFERALATRPPDSPAATV
jgi:hypothetical protein